MPGSSGVQTLHKCPLIQFGGTETLSEGPSESAGAHVRFVDSGPSGLYGNIMTFGETGFLGARRGRAINACDTASNVCSDNMDDTFLGWFWRHSVCTETRWSNGVIGITVHVRETNALLLLLMKERTLSFLDQIHNSRHLY